MASFQPPWRPPTVVTPVPLPKQPSASSARGFRNQSRITIPLRSKPRDYAPGSGPPLQRVSLLPPHDSTAYIVERILLPSPGPAANGKPLPKRMTYIVGWRDLAAARMLVPAMNVLDYVSPRALEEWEWELEQELDKDRAQMEENKRLNKAVGGKKRGRPPAHSQIEAAAVAAEPETEAQTKERLQKGAMSLSTPQKTRLLDFEGVSEDEDESPSRQLERESIQVPRQYVRDSESAEGDRLGGASKDRVSRLSLPNLPGLRWDSSMETSEEPVGFSERLLDQNGAALASDGRTAFPDSTSASRKDSSAHPFFPRAGGSATTAAPGFRDPLAQRPATGQRPKTAKRSSKQKPKSIKREQENKRRLADEESLGDAEPGWEVKHLEGVELFEVEGRGIMRYFKVRWEGDWPPEQNPSWEPEENLPPALVRSYLKTSKKRRKTSHDHDDPMPQLASDATRPRANGTKQGNMVGGGTDEYRSVEDALAGDSGDMAIIEDGPAVRKYTSSDEDELFVVGQGQRVRVNSGWKGNNGRAVA